MTSCTPHTGDLNDDWMPVTDTGKLFMPGIRSCQRKDCVNPDHVGKTAITCSIDKCDSRPYSQDLCNKHFYQSRSESGRIINKQDVLQEIVDTWIPDESATSCSYNDCKRAYKAKGLCFTHYMSWYQFQARLTKIRALSVTKL